MKKGKWGRSRSSFFLILLAARWSCEVQNQNGGVGGSVYVSYSIYFVVYVPFYERFGGGVVGEGDDGGVGWVLELGEREK